MTPHQPWRDANAHDDLLDETIRSAMRARVAHNQPAGDGWARLRSQVRAGPARRRRLAVLQFRHLLNAMAQGAAAMLVIALLGATFTQERPAEVTPMQVAADVQTVAVVAPPSAPLYVPPDVPRYVITRNRLPAVPVYPSTRVDMLNLAALLKAQPVALERDYDPALLPLVDPRLDPTLFAHAM